MPNRSRGALPPPEPTEAPADLTPEPYAGAFAGREAEANLGLPAENVKQGSQGEPMQPDVPITGQLLLAKPRAHSSEGFAAVEAQNRATLHPLQSGPPNAIMGAVTGDVGAGLNRPQDQGGRAPSTDLEQRPPLPLPPEGAFHSSTPPDYPAIPESHAPGGRPNLPAYFVRSPIQGPDIPGVFTEDTNPPPPQLHEPYPFWQDWFTLPQKIGAGYDDWEEMGRCRLWQSSQGPIMAKYLEGSGVPRVAVFPNSADPTKYDLHMYSWQGENLRHFIAAISPTGDDLEWVEQTPSVKFYGENGTINTDDFFDTSEFINPSKAKTEYDFWAADMAVVYFWAGLIYKPVPELRFYFWPESNAGLLKSPLQCATTKDGYNFYASNVLFSPQYGDNGWVTVPQAIRMPNGDWWMYYVGNIPEREYESSKKPKARRHSTRIQYSTDNGVSWKPKYPSGDIEYPDVPPFPWIGTYNSFWGLPNTRVDPEVVHLENSIQDFNKPKYRMYVKGQNSLEVTESWAGLNWGALKPLGIGKYTERNLKTGKRETRYHGCYDQSVFRIPSKKRAFMLYVMDDDKIHYARLKW